jgi:serine/threonine protein kinase/WD40 repeat protein
MSSQDDGQAVLEDLMSLWQRRRAEGESPTPAELCRERPELLPELERRIALLMQMSALADVTHSTGTLEGGGAGKAGELTAFLAPAQAPDELGRLRGYRVLEVLGRGGMGVVFRAEDPKLRRQLALKAMLPTLAVIDEARERFLREARTAAAVEHDNVVVIHQVSEDRGVPFLAMPLLRGESLDDRLKREGRLPIGEVLRIGQEAAKGLAAAHKRGLIHRDIKPANLWLEEETGRVKVLDFGLARALNAGEPLTRQGSILGTPAYMSPEQASGEPVDARSDLFSLGCVLYRMTTGQLPFQGKDAVSTLLSVARDTPAAPSAVNPEASPELSAFILKMLSKDPAGRPASAQEASKALEALRAESGRDSATLQMNGSLPRSDQPSATPPVAAARPRRRRTWIAAAVLLPLLIGGGVVATIVIRIKRPDGKEIEIKVPDDNTVVVEKNGKVLAKVGPDAAKPPAPAKPAVVAAGPSSLDKLDPTQIPASERFDWQPKQLVAVLGEHRQRHWGAASGVAVSRDGKHIATTGEDGMIRFWNPVTLREIYSVRARPPGNGVWGPAFSPDGKRLAVVDWPGVAFYDLSGAQPVREKTVLDAGGDGCCRLAFTPDGKRLIGPDNGGTLYLWDLANGQTKPAWKRTIFRTGYSANPTPFDLSAHGRTLACFSDAKTATLLDISGAEPREILAVPLPAAAWSLALSPDAKRLAVGFQDRKIRFWGVGGKTPEPEGEIDFGPDPGVLRFSPDGKRLAGAYTAIRLWDFERKAWIAETPFIHGACTDFSFAPDGQALIAAWGGGTVQF